MTIRQAVGYVVASAALAATQAGETAVLLLPDLAIRETAGGLQLFVADPNRGVVRTGVVARDSRSIAIGTLEPATPCGPIERPVALTVRDARLVVVQGEPVPAVHECDLETGTPRVLLRGEPLRVPASAAIAADGTVVVLDRILRGVVALRRDERPAVVRVSDSPMLLRADDLGRLFVVDVEARGILPISLAESLREPYGVSAVQKRSNLGGAFLPLMAEPAAFAVYRDVFYVAESGGPTRVQLPAGRLSLEIPDIRPRQASIAASRSHLATIDREATSVEIFERPLPAGVVLDPTRGNPNEAWLELLEYLATRRLLARDRVQVTPDDRSYDDVLRRNGVLVKVDVHPEKVAVAPGRTKPLFCAMNPPLCDAGYSPETRSVVIPQAAPQPVLHTEMQPLEGKDVRSWVSERVLLASHQKEVTDAYLATRNAGVASSLETELRRRQMVMATPMDARLEAGTIIRIAGGKEDIVGPIGPRCAGLAPSTSKTALMSQLSAPAEAVPGAVAAPRSSRVRMLVGSWTRSSISLAALQKCALAEDGPERYVITEAIAASEVAFEAPGGTAVDARPPVSGPFYVGYKVVPLSGLSAGVAIPVVDPERVKPLPSSDSSPLWTVASGSLTLPLTRWRADVLLPSADFYRPDGALRKLQNAHASLDLSPRERLDRAALSSGHRHAPPDADVAGALEAARLELVKAITYDEVLAEAAGTEDVTIGIVEHSSSVNLDHPGFVADGASAWTDYVEGTGLQPHRPGAPGPATPPSLRRANIAAEHGTHVAGTIGARRPPALTLGMLPKTRLYLVASDSMGDLKANIQTARDELVFLFNMSLGFTPATPNEIIQDLHNRMRDGWRDALFVIAAGNDGADLNATGALAPVVWANSLANVLTVGAADDRGEQVLGQHQDGTDPDEPKGSNFGSRFVDLLAPGRLVHSFGRDGYAYACGSSHAAPQVTATAAMLWPQIQKPEVVRARLVYTADWKEPNFDRKVWGGLLNVKRAVFAPKHNVFIRHGSDPTPHDIKLDVGTTIRIDGDIQLRDGDTTPFRDNNFPFGRILRIAPLGAGRSRVAFLSREGVLTILEGTVSGSVKCRDVKRFDKDTQRFSLPPEVQVNCQQGISVGQFQDYVAATPASVKFR